MKAFPSACFVPLFALQLLGCYEVTATRPVGDQPLESESEEWEGIWVIEGTPLYIVDVEPSEGHFRLAGLDEDEGGGLTLREEDLFLRKSGDWVIWSTPRQEEDAGSPTRYWFGRVVKNGDELLLWLPDFDKIGGLVRAGTLPGTLQGSELHLHDLEPHQVAVLTSEAHGVLFDWDAPLIARRLSKKRRV